MKWFVVLFFAEWIAGAGHPAWAQNPPDDVIVNEVTVDDKNVPITQNRSLNLGARPTNIFFQFGYPTNAPYAGLRIRYKLDGYDADWHDEGGYMLLVVHFYNEAGDQISREEFRVTGKSAGWVGSLDGSALTHRREMLVAPPHAARLVVAISSAGPMTTIGLYAVANLKLTRIQSNAPPVTLLEFPPSRGALGKPGDNPVEWARDGNVPSMARIVTVGRSPPQKALAILDDNAAGHAGWRNSRPAAPAVAPGDRILAEWDEMFCMGVADLRGAHYQELPEGHYLLRVAQFDMYGKPAANESVLAVTVPPPLWRQPWFWPLCALLAAAVALANWRYLAWRKVRAEMVQLKSQQALENERLRIAQDIHDDLGARITEISLASALAKKTAASPESATADFDRISALSRELITALYETVWAVNPANDNLDSLGTYLCQITAHLCKQSQLPCHLELDELPRTVQVSSQIRHNIVMAIKEAAHNAVKHARASEITLHMDFQEPELTIRLSDNGVGFKSDGAAAAAPGHGLNNIKRRVADIGARCQIDSQPGRGTAVQIRITLKNFPLR